MKTLLHGTTRTRAEQILREGPNPHFHEPGVQASENSFSAFLEGGPFLFGTPADYACGKAAQFPNEGGPAIVVVEVPEDIIALTDDGWFPQSQGLIQFDSGAGLEELAAAWATLQKRITIPECP